MPVVIESAYCCSKCGVCFKKAQLKVKAYKGERVTFLHYFCPKCGSKIYAETISLV